MARLNILTIRPVHTFSHESGRYLMACLCLPTVLSFLLLPSADAEQTWTADIFDGIERAVIAKDPSAMGRRCIVANMGLMSGNAFEAYTPVLQPGEYSAAVRLKLPYINNMNTAPLHWVFAAGEAGKGSRGFDILLIEIHSVFEISCVGDVRCCCGAKICFRFHVPN